jgi:hypothetical protein
MLTQRKQRLRMHLLPARVISLQHVVDEVAGVPVAVGEVGEVVGA